MGIEIQVNFSIFPVPGDRNTLTYYIVVYYQYCNIIGVFCVIMLQTPLFVEQSFAATMESESLREVLFGMTPPGRAFCPSEPTLKYGAPIFSERGISLLRGDTRWGGSYLDLVLEG